MPFGEDARPFGEDARPFPEDTAMPLCDDTDGTVPLGASTYPETNPLVKGTVGWLDVDARCAGLGLITGTSSGGEGGLAGAGDAEGDLAGAEKTGAADEGVLAVDAGGSAAAVTAEKTGAAVFGGVGPALRPGEVALSTAGTDGESSFSTSGNLAASLSVAVGVGGYAPGMRPTNCDLPAEEA